ncbi:MAG: hypothetical protein JSV76_04305 [Candidatus Bathyarchaeota archaeon]|nr:MAG: hypothetical protein JSV76_04305 [Candidatus Bathyarchaeota archaeon]
MFDIYPPLLYAGAAFGSQLLGDVAAIMKIMTILSFTSLPLALYRLGRTLGRSPKGATVVAWLFALTPLNGFFLFNGYLLLIPSLVLMILFLSVFFQYTQSGDMGKWYAAIAMLVIIALSYHRALYVVLFVLFFHFSVKLYRRQLREAMMTALLVVFGLGISAFWVLPALINMFTINSPELYQSLVSVAAWEGVSFHVIALLFIVPYWYLVVKRLRMKCLRNDTEVVLVLSLVFFTLLALGPYGPLHYILPFSSSQRPELSILFVTFLAITIATRLFDDRIREGKRTFMGIMLSSLTFLLLLSCVFISPMLAQGFQQMNFNYSRNQVEDSLHNVINHAYVQQQVFLGTHDHDFLEVLRYLSGMNQSGRVVFYSDRSQTADMFYYYALLPLSGKPSPQGIAPDGEGDLKWNDFTQPIIWSVNQTLLQLSGTRWIISNHPVAINGVHRTQLFNQYWLYELDSVAIIDDCDHSIDYGLDDMHIRLYRDCEQFTLKISYHPRWHAFDQHGNALEIERSDYGFMKINGVDNLNEVILTYSKTMIDMLSETISVICVIVLIVFLFFQKRSASKALRHEVNESTSRAQSVDRDGDQLVLMINHR